MRDPIIIAAERLMALHAWFLHMGLGRAADDGHGLPYYFFSFIVIIIIDNIVIILASAPAAHACCPFYHLVQQQN